MDETHGFDAEDAGELDVRRVSETGEEFGAVEAEGFDLDEDLAFVRCGDWAGFEFEGSRGPGGGGRRPSCWPSWAFGAEGEQIGLFFFHGGETNEDSDQRAMNTKDESQEWKFQTRSTPNRIQDIICTKHVPLLGVGCLPKSLTKRCWWLTNAFKADRHDWSSAGSALDMINGSIQSSKQHYKMQRIENILGGEVDWVFMTCGVAGLIRSTK